MHPLLLPEILIHLAPCVPVWKTTDSSSYPDYDPHQVLNCTLVCRTWHTAFFPQLWRVYDRKVRRRKPSEEIVKLFLRNSAMMRILDHCPVHILKLFVPLTANTTTLSTMTLPTRLVELTLESDCFEGVMILQANLNGLKKLDWEGWLWQNQLEVEYPILQLKWLWGLKKLETLKLTFWRLDGGGGDGSSGSGGDGDADEVKDDDGGGVQGTSQRRTFWDFVAKTESLKELKLYGMEDFDPIDKALVFKNLTSFGWCSEAITKDGWVVEELVRRCPWLQKLVLEAPWLSSQSRSCPDLHTLADQIQKYCPDLVWLEVFSVDVGEDEDEDEVEDEVDEEEKEALFERGVAYLVRSTQRLERFQMDTGPLGSLLTEALAHHGKSLQSLQMGCTSFGEETFKSLGHILSNCSMLKDVDLSAEDADWDLDSVGAIFSGDPSTPWACSSTLEVLNLYSNVPCGNISQNPSAVLQDYPAGEDMDSDVDQMARIGWRPKDGKEDHFLKRVQKTGLTYWLGVQLKKMPRLVRLQVGQEYVRVSV